MLTIGMFLVLVLVARPVPFRPVAKCTLALIAGAGLAIASGNADIWFVQLERTGSSLDVATSGRLSLWIDSLGVWSDSWSSILFGLGPDAMRLHVRAEIGFPPIIQAHNSLVQVLLEFGLIGCGYFIALIALVGQRVARLLMNRAAAVEGRVVAAILIVMFGYTLLDGILYHAIPLVFVTLLTAYVFSLDGESNEVAIATRSSSTFPDPKTQS